MRLHGCGRVFDASRPYLDLRPERGVRRADEVPRPRPARRRAPRIHRAAGARIEDPQRHAPPLPAAGPRRPHRRSRLRQRPRDRLERARRGASILGVDISPFFADGSARQGGPDARRSSTAARCGPRRSTRPGRSTCSSTCRPRRSATCSPKPRACSTPDGALFIYTHVRRNGWPAAGVRAVNRLARLCERVGLLDLRQERLRKSDHLNPIADHDDLASHRGRLRLSRRAHHVLLAHHRRLHGEHRRAHGRASPGPPGRPERLPAPAPTASAPVKAARRSAQARVRRGGAVYWALRAATGVMKLDVLLFGRVQTGPFFALLRRTGDALGAAAARMTTPVRRARSDRARHARRLDARAGRRRRSGARSATTSTSPRSRRRVARRRRDLARHGAAARPERAALDSRRAPSRRWRGRSAPTS